MIVVCEQIDGLKNCKMEKAEQNGIYFGVNFLLLLNDSITNAIVDDIIRCIHLP